MPSFLQSILNSLFTTVWKKTKRPEVCNDSVEYAHAASGKDNYESGSTQGPQQNHVAHGQTSLTMFPVVPEDKIASLGVSIAL